jgi:hypothetical protein
LETDRKPPAAEAGDFHIIKYDADLFLKKPGAEAALLHGYNPSRRATNYVLADSLFRAQWAGARDAEGKACSASKNPVAVPAHAIGPYGDAYAHRRAVTADREGWTAEHQKNDAIRYAWKKLLCHFRAAWIANSQTEGPTP